MTSAEFFQAIKAGDVERVQAMIEREPELVNDNEQDSLAPVMMATYYGRRAVADLLLAHGARLDIFAAAALGKSAQLEQMVQADPSLLQAYSPDGWTPLHLAAYFGDKHAIEILLAHGADLHAVSTNSNHNHPLHAAVSNNQKEAVEVLIAHGADVNARQEQGWTPLHGAAQNGNLVILSILLAHGADIHAANEEGKTALSLAQGQNHADVVDVLKNTGATA